MDKITHNKPINYDIQSPNKSAPQTSNQAVVPAKRTRADLTNLTAAGSGCLNTAAFEASSSDIKPRLAPINTHPESPAEATSEPCTPEFCPRPESDQQFRVQQPLVSRFVDTTIEAGLKPLANLFPEPEKFEAMLQLLSLLKQQGGSGIALGGSGALMLHGMQSSTQGPNWQRIPADLDIFVQKGYEPEVGSMLNQLGFSVDQPWGITTPALTFTSDQMSVDVVIGDVGKTAVSKKFQIPNFKDNIHQTPFGQILNIETLKMLANRRLDLICLPPDKIKIHDDLALMESLT